MTVPRVLLVTLSILVGLSLAPAGGFAAVSTDAEAGPADSMGERLSGFMQSSAADAEDGVEGGMFDAAYERADGDRDREAVVDDRIDRLEQRLTAAEAEYDELRERANESNGTVYAAELTRLTVEIASLERSIDHTESRATDTGVDADRLAALRANASALGGQEVAATAQGLPGIDPPGQTADAPGQNASAGDEPGQNASTGDEPGQSDVDAGETGAADRPAQNESDDGSSEGNESPAEPPGQNESASTAEPPE